MSFPGEVSPRPVGGSIGVKLPSIQGRETRGKSEISPASKEDSQSRHVAYQGRDIQEIPENSSGSAGGSIRPVPNAGKRFRNGKVHPIDTLSVAESRVTGLSDDEDSNGVSTVDQSASTQRSSSLWTSLRAAVSFNSAFLAKKRAKNSTQRVDSFLEQFTIRGRENTGYDDPESVAKNGEEYAALEESRTFTIDPDGYFMFYWLLVITIAFEYNIWFLIAREAWSGLQEKGGAAWFVLDYLCDFVYLLDICIQFRTGYLEHGILVKDGRLLAKHYMRSQSFALDLLALTPLDFLYIVNLIRLHTILRFPRLLKAYRLTAWYYMAEAKAILPAVFRIVNICHVLLVLVHWFAALYFLFCDWIGFGSGKWVYPYPEGEFNSTTRMYLMSLYWSTLTLTLLGDIPVPSSELEYVFQIISYLIGVVVFATIVGQVGIVIENRNSLRLEFERNVDNAKKYMRSYKVAEDVQNRVLLWYFYSWKRSRTDVNSLGPLPTKLRTELAIHVHLKTLKKVNIFRKCPPEFLHDLVLKMHTCIHTPGDLVCRRGEVAREMFIISDGLLEVVRSDGQILTTLQPGDFFGEIGILNLEGTANRRTADVRSVGYSELFTLSKGDVLDALRDFPQAQEQLEEEAKRRLSTNRKSPPCKSRAREEGDSSCTEASDSERLVNTTKGSEGNPPVKPRQQLVSSPRGGVPDGGDLYRPLASPGTWRPKPTVALKPPRRKRGSRGGANSRDKDDEAWLTEVAATVQEKLKERLVMALEAQLVAQTSPNQVLNMDYYNKENRQQLRKLEDELKAKDKDKSKKDAEIQKLNERVLLLEDLLKTADVKVS